MDEKELAKGILGAVFVVAEGGTSADQERLLELAEMTTDSFLEDDLRGGPQEYPDDDDAPIPTAAKSRTKDLMQRLIDDKRKSATKYVQKKTGKAITSIPVVKAEPCHVPSGPGGGQFTSCADGSSGADSHENAAFGNSTQAHEWADKHANKGLGKLSETEDDAVSSYRGNGHRSINGALRGTLPTNSRSEELTAVLDGVMSRSTTNEHVYAQRGVNDKRVIKQLDQAFQTGVSLVDNGFVSTTLDRSIAPTFSSGKRGAVINLSIPKGTHSYYHTNSGEAELMLARGCKMSVEKKREVDGVTHFDVMVHGTGYSASKATVVVVKSEQGDKSRFVWEDGDLVLLDTKSVTIQAKEPCHVPAGDPAGGQFTSCGGGDAGGGESGNAGHSRAEKEAAEKVRVVARFDQMMADHKEAMNDWEERRAASIASGSREERLRVLHEMPKLDKVALNHLYNDLPGDVHEPHSLVYEDLSAKHMEGKRWLVNDNGFVHERAEGHVRLMFDGEIPGHDEPNYTRDLQKIADERRLLKEFPQSREELKTMALTKDLKVIPTDQAGKGDMKLTSRKAAEALWNGLPHESEMVRNIDGERYVAKRINSDFALLNSRGGNPKLVSAVKARIKMLDIFSEGKESI